MDFEKLGRKIRESFLSDLENIGLGDVFKIPLEYLIGKERFFGDFYAIYLSEIVGIHDENVIISLGNAFLFGRAFVISQDQVLDNLKNPNIDYILASPILYQEFVKRIKMLVSGTSFVEDMQKILKKAREANIKEQYDHRNKILPYTLEDLGNLGRKTGLVKIPAKAVCYLSNNEGYAERIASISDNILVSIQICDDLSDVAEDFRNGNYTIPVTHGILLSPDKTETEKSMYQGLFLSGLFESLLSYNLTLLGNTESEILSVVHECTQAQKYVSLLKKHLSYILEKFRNDKGLLDLEETKENDFTNLESVKCSRDVNMFKPYLELLEPGNISPEKLM